MNSSEFLLCSLNKGKQNKINYINRELKGALLKLLSVFGNNEKKSSVGGGTQGINLKAPP